MTRKTVKQGDTWAFQVGWYAPLVPITDPPVPDLANPINITGYQARLQVRKGPGETVVLSLTSSPPGGLTVTGPAGTVDVRATPAQMTAIEPGTWQWEIEIDNSVDRYTLDGGPLAVKAQIVT